jgi:hypothetical protein
VVLFCFVGGGGFHEFDIHMDLASYVVLSCHAFSFFLIFFSSP